MKQKWIFTLLMVLCFVLAGCGGKNYSKIPVPEENLSGVVSEKLNVNVYIDGTSSMGGYVNFQGETPYEQALFTIDNVVQQISKQNKIQYIKFGDKNTNLSRENLVAVKNVGFYNEKDTAIDTLVGSTNNNNLNIVVTDLFQTNQDLGRLVNFLNEKYLKVGKSVAIIGFKSPFNGKIYDIGKAVATVDYTSNANVESYRPVYFLLMGNTMDVREFISKFIQNNSQMKSKVAIFDKELGINNELDINDKLSAEVLKEDKQKKIVSMAEIENLIDRQDNIKQLRWKLDEKVSKVYLTVDSEHVLMAIPEDYQLLINKFQYLASVDGSVKKDVGVLDKIKGIFGGKKQTGNEDFVNIDSKNVIKGYYLDSLQEGDKANINIALTFEPRELKAKQTGIYRLEFALIPTYDAYQKSYATFREWNFDDSQLNGGINLQNIGNKTLNIAYFIERLAAINYENKPGFYNNWLYLEAKD